MVTRAEEYQARKSRNRSKSGKATSLATARERYRKVAPILRGLLAVPTTDADWPYLRFVLQPLINDDVLDFVDSARGKEISISPPLTSDHLIPTKALPLWIAAPPSHNEAK